MGLSLDIRSVSEGEPHDIKVIATDDHGNAAEAWISGKEFYLKKEARVAV